MQIPDESGKTFLDRKSVLFIGLSYSIPVSYAQVCECVDFVFLEVWDNVIPNVEYNLTCGISNSSI